MDGFCPGFELSGWGRGIRWPLGGDEGWDGIGRAKPGVLPAHLQRGHGASQGLLLHCLIFTFIFWTKVSFLVGVGWGLVLLPWQAALKQLNKNKVPNMAVMLKSLNHTHTDAKAVFKDPTGKYADGFSILSVRNTHGFTPTPVQWVYMSMVFDERWDSGHSASAPPGRALGGTESWRRAAAQTSEQTPFLI